MNLCDDGHEEVCYECRNCPACEAIKERDAAVEEAEKLQRDLEELEDRYRMETM